MAGRILPIALATVVGVSIGVATFDRELKEQRRKRLQEEYDQYVEFSNTLHSTFTYYPGREVAATAALTRESLTPMASNAIPPPSSSQVPIQDRDVHGTKASGPESTPSWSSILGLWAWDKNVAQKTKPVAQEPTSEQSKTSETAGKP
jgi:hypothetical protein